MGSLAHLGDDLGAVSKDFRGELERLHPSSWRWALSCCRGDRQAAHDVLHDVYVGVLSGQISFHGRSAFKTWLFGVIRRASLGARRRRRLLDLVFEPLGPAAEAVTAPGPSSVLLRQTLAAAARLPARQRETAVLVFAHDLTIEEAAQVMNISVGAARQHHARAKQKLRLTLAGPEETHHG